MLDTTDPGPLPRELGALIRRLRVQQGLSSLEFAKRAGLEPADIDALEDGKSEFELDELFAIARGLGMDLSTVFRIWDADDSHGVTDALDEAPHGSTPP